MLQRRLPWPREAEAADQGYTAHKWWGSYPGSGDGFLTHFSTLVPSIRHENSVCSLNEITHIVRENENNHYLNVNYIVGVQ